MIRILVRRPERLGLYCWLDQLQRRWEAVSDFSVGWRPPADTDLLVTHQHYSGTTLEILSAVKRETSIPILILADGILEYRNTWLNPQLVPGALFRPVVGDKLACLGSRQADIVSAWGNTGKCEVIGLPRLDHLLTESRVRRSVTGRVRVLVMTARQYGFTPEQRERTERGLADLRDWFASQSEEGGVRFEPVWRLTGDLSVRLGLENELSDLEGGELLEQLAGVDAVVTTHSTTILEAALSGRPVAVLDYQQVPNYVHTAWTITHAGEIGSVMRELADPPAAKWAFQQEMLREQLRCDSAATPRLLELIEVMARAGEVARERGESLRLPERIVSVEGSVESMERFEFSAIQEEWQERFRGESLEGDEVVQGMATLQLAKVQSAQAELVQQLRGLQRQLERSEEATGRWEETAERRREMVEEQRGRIEELRARANRLSGVVERLRGEIEVWKETWEGIESVERARMKKWGRQNERIARFESLLGFANERIERLEQELSEALEPNSLLVRLRSWIGLN